MTAVGPAVRPSPQVLWRRVPRGFVLLGPDHDPVLLTGTSVFLWELLLAGCAVGDLTARLADQYQTTREAIQADVDAALMRLASAGLVGVEP